MNARRLIVSVLGVAIVATSCAAPIGPSEAARQAEKARPAESDDDDGTTTTAPPSSCQTTDDTARSFRPRVRFPRRAKCGPAPSCRRSRPGTS